MMSHKDVASNYSVVLAVLTEIHKPHLVLTICHLFEMDGNDLQTAEIYQLGLFQLQEKVSSLSRRLSTLGQPDLFRYCYGAYSTR